MREAMFDESYNVREVLDDVLERVAVREKLIQTAKQFSEKKREERFTLATRQFEILMADFLRLYQPILERLRSYRDGIQKEIISLKTAERTDDLFNRIKPFQSSGMGMPGRDSLSDVLAGMPKDLFPENPDMGKEPTRKSGA